MHSTLCQKVEHLGGLSEWGLLAPSCPILYLGPGQQSDPNSSGVDSSYIWTCDTADVLLKPLIFQYRSYTHTYLVQVQ